MQKTWIERKVEKILKEAGPNTAQRFLNNRGGATRHHRAAQLIFLARQKQQAA